MREEDREIQYERIGRRKGYHRSVGESNTDKTEEEMITDREFGKGKRKMRLTQKDVEK